MASHSLSEVSPLLSGDPEACRSQEQVPGRPYTWKAWGKLRRVLCRDCWRPAARLEAGGFMLWTSYAMSPEQTA